MRFSVLISLGLSALLAVAIAIAAVAYTSSEKTITTLKRLSATFEPTRHRLESLSTLFLGANMQFQLVANSEFVHEAELIQAFQMLDQRLASFVNRAVHPASSNQNLRRTIAALPITLTEALKSKNDRQSRPLKWRAARSQLEKRLVSIRADITHLADKTNTKTDTNVASAMLGHVENMFLEFADQPVASIDRVISPLNQAAKVIDMIESERNEAHTLQFSKEVVQFRGALARFKAAMILFDDETKLVVSGASLQEIFETANIARASALKSLETLKAVVEDNVRVIQREEIDAGDRRQRLFLIFAVIAVLIAFTTAFALRRIMDRRIGTLVEGTEKIAHGNREFRLSSGTSDEFERVSAAVNIMVDDLGNTISALEAAQEEARAAKEKAESANQMKTTFMANMSHELRTPLNAIIGFSEVMRRQMFGKLGSQQYEDYASDIEKSGKHLLKLINTILDLSKIESGKMEFEFVEIHLADFLKEAVKFIEAQAQEKNIEIVSKADPSMPLLTADRTAIHQIFLNILSNAVKFTRPGGSIETNITYNEQEGHLITITDTGIGIPSRDLEVVMMPFGQSRNVMTDVVGGTGLGLSISRSIIENLGGTLDLSSKFGVGTTVLIRFPVRKAVLPPAKRLLAQPI